MNRCIYVNAVCVYRCPAMLLYMQPYGVDWVTEYVLTHFESFPSSNSKEEYIKLTDHGDKTKIISVSWGRIESAF